MDRHPQHMPNDGILIVTHMVAVVIHIANMAITATHVDTIRDVMDSAIIVVGRASVRIGTIITIRQFHVTDIRQHMVTQIGVGDILVM